jgi:hypothetical protein
MILKTNGGPAAPRRRTAIQEGRNTLFADFLNAGKEHPPRYASAGEGPQRRRPLSPQPVHPYTGYTLQTDDVRKELVQWVRKEIGPIAQPDLIQWAPGLPKTRSGKIMRRILRKIAENDYSNLGDISTLADPTVVQELVNNRMNRA